MFECLCVCFFFSFFVCFFLYFDCFCLRIISSACLPKLNFLEGSLQHFWTPARQPQFWSTVIMWGIVRRPRSFIQSGRWRTRPSSAPTHSDQHYSLTRGLLWGTASPIDMARLCKLSKMNLGSKINTNIRKGQLLARAQVFKCPREDCSPLPSKN